MTAVRLRRAAGPVAWASGEVAEEDIVVSSRAGRRGGTPVSGREGGEGGEDGEGGEGGGACP
ncbi:hypothetical protein Srubr_36640 [Streptomyces rubradiris]|uniref:Uncharacterized protein n=1 Tax=Streptomyces rubradiris TaxID=285531 RepID=A0ABQ3RD89_STRRR|nr:hypothetical protein GCM10018792_05560 [Streptomyces rubradiris]GHI53818.1 hypothetical protein Srubr_36640 [Streptomyces rubradiris]